EIFEGRAAGLLMEHFRKAMPEVRGSTIEGASSKALLIGELQAPGSGMEDVLIDTASGASRGGPSIFGLDTGQVESRQRFLSIALGALDKGMGVIHISFDGGQSHADIPGAVVYRSLYPERVHLLISCGAGEAAVLDGRERPGYLLESIPELGSLLAGADGLGPRARVDVIESCGGIHERRRIDWAELARFLSGSGSAGPAGVQGGRRVVLEGLTSRINEVFDPRGIMLK
ncbi:MAG: hypothetical protein KAX38_01030, partial [Candidatus Krumholzibacteria bacterium]|nr:hypothetical protein [Candidatus Krumholzibacteria bacterium]